MTKKIVSLLLTIIMILPITAYAESENTLPPNAGIINFAHTYDNITGLVELADTDVQKTVHLLFGNGLLAFAIIVSGVYVIKNADEFFLNTQSSHNTQPSPNMQSAEKIEKVKELELEPNAVDWQGVKPKNTGYVEQGIAIPGFKNITIDANTRDVTVNFNNPEGNPCYFKISLLLSDGTLLYQSKKIKPGKGLYNIKLMEPLAKGEYNAVVKYETYSLNGQKPMNGAEVNIVLIAE